MLRITIPAGEIYDERTNEFLTSKEQTLQLEHSLVSISKWESKWHKPFFSTKAKTTEETIYYIQCMTLTQNVNPMVYKFLTQSNINEINSYIEDPMTATTFAKDNPGRTSREQITSELVYYWMTAFNIPVKFEKWHLNRLLTLIRVCNLKNSPPKKRSKKALASDYARINERNKRLIYGKGQ